MSTVTTPTSAPIPGYGLAPPTAHDALAFLARGVVRAHGADEWLRACRRAGTPSADLSVDEMMRVSERLAEQTGVVGIIGTSLMVRVRTYRLLAGSAARAEAGR